MKKKLLIIASCFAAVILILIITLLLFRTKSPSVSDADLAYVRTAVSSNENAFFILEKAAKKLSWPANPKDLEKIIRWESWDATQVEEVLNKNQEPLSILQNAMSLPRLQVPEIQSFDEEYEYLKEWKNLSQLFALHSITLFYDGKEKEAFEAARQLISLGNQMENSDGVPIHYLVGLAVKSMGAKTLQQLISRSSLPCGSVPISPIDLNQLQANETALANATKTQYQLQSKSADDYAKGTAMGITNQGPQLTGMPRILFDPQKTRQRYALIARSQINSISRTYNDMPEDPVALSTNRSIISLLISGNAVGEILADLSLPSKQFMSRKCRENVNAAATQVIFALKCYKEKQGVLPTSLEQLVPEFLSAIPIDDFDGKPLRYSVENKIIYSIGQDLIDSGGQEVDAKKKQLDIVFKLQF